MKPVVTLLAFGLALLPAPVVAQNAETEVGAAVARYNRHWWQKTCLR